MESNIFGSPKRKRFLLFAFDSHYPAGGVMDAHSGHSVLEQAFWTTSGLDKDRFQILDTETGDLWA